MKYEYCGNPYSDLWPEPDFCLDNCGSSQDPKDGSSQDGRAKQFYWVWIQDWDSKSRWF